MNCHVDAKQLIMSGAIVAMDNEDSGIKQSSSADFNSQYTHSAKMQTCTECRSFSYSIDVKKLVQCKQVDKFCDQKWSHWNSIIGLPLGGTTFVKLERGLMLAV